MVNPTLEAWQCEGLCDIVLGKGILASLLDHPNRG